jgi:transposase
MDLSSSLSFSFGILFRELEHLRALKKELFRELMLLSRSERYKEDVEILKSMPGIGVLTAIRLVLELGDISRFKRKEEFASFLGLIPSEYSSGDQERKGHITKQGNRGVRAWLVESAWVAIRYDPAILKKYRSVFGRCGSKKKAIVAVAHKLAIRIRAILISREPYIIGVIE